MLFINHKNSKEMKKRFMFLFPAMLAVAAAHADTYPYLTFQTADGTTVSIKVESLMMTFSDGKLVVSNGTDSQELTVVDLSSMYFSTSDATGIKEVAISDADGEVEAFSLQGVSYGKFSNLQAFKGKATPGVYVVKSNGKTQKITVR